METEDFAHGRASFAQWRDGARRLRLARDSRDTAWQSPAGPRRLRLQPNRVNAIPGRFDTGAVRRLGNERDGRHEQAPWALGMGPARRDRAHPRDCWASVRAYVERSDPDHFVAWRLRRRC